MVVYDTVGAATIDATFGAVKLRGHVASALDPVMRDLGANGIFTNVANLPH